MTEKKPKEKRRWLHLPARLLGGLLSLVMMALATLSLIIARPQPEADDTAAAVPQPVLTASPAMTIAAESELPELIRPFPIPVMSFMSGAGVHFVSGSSEDLAVDGGFGRVLSLFWQTEAGQPLILQSIYPATAFSALQGEGWHFSRIAGPTLCGRSSVRMENDTSVRIHIATEEGLYAVLVPSGLSAELSALVRSLQLYTVEDP